MLTRNSSTAFASRKRTSSGLKRVKPLHLWCGLLIAAIGLLILGYACPVRSTGALRTGLSKRVLFLGNSYTYANDLPRVFAELARAGGHEVETGMLAQGGMTLADHDRASETQRVLATSHWDFVVVQEQSLIPSVEPSRSVAMYPAARSLVQKIRTAGAAPVFFMAWARRGGWPERGFANYDSMQAEIERGYLDIARELHAPVAPVGVAWRQAVQRSPAVNLWQDDGSHPSLQGTYLAACVFYAVIFRISPFGVPYDAGLPHDTAQQLQKLAGDTVLTNATEWNLP